MKVDAVSPEENVQLAWSAPLSPAQRPFRLTAALAELVSSPRQQATLAPPPPHTETAKQGQAAGGSHLWPTQRQSPSAAGVLETFDDDLAC